MLEGGLTSYHLSISDHRRSHETLLAHRHRAIRNKDSFQVSEINVIEDTRHDFRIEAIINGKPQKHVVGRISDLAAEIIAKGRNKVPVENKKGLWNGCFCLWLEENS